MIDEATKAEILRLHHVEGMKPGTIARALSVHHSTVTRALEGRTPEKAKRPRAIDGVRELLLMNLERHPQITASRLYEIAREAGYEGGRDHFRHEVARIRPRKQPEAFLRLSAIAGEEGQVDWGHFGTVQVGRAKRRLMAFVVVLSFSRAIFLRFYHDDATGSFLRGHQAAFDFFQGVPRRMLYDNLKSAVISRCGDAILFNDELLRLSGKCLFEPRAAGVRRGNEKGRVERAIRYIRSSFFDARRFADIHDLNDQALAWVAGPALERPWPDDRTRSVKDALAEERRDLLPAPVDLAPVEDVIDVRVPKWPYVRFDRNDYSVPAEHVRKMLVVRATEREVRVLDGTSVVAHHRRSFGSGVVVEDPAHVAELKRQKRRARKGAAMNRLLIQVPVVEELLRHFAERGMNIGSAVHNLTLLHDTYGREALEGAIEEAIRCETFHIPAVRSVIERTAMADPEPPRRQVSIPEDSKAAGITVRMTDYRDFDRLTQPVDEEETGS